MTRPIDELHGMDVPTAAKLLAAGVDTAEALLERCRSRVARRRLAELCRIDADRLREWAGQADLLRVTGIGPHHAHRLTRAGCTTVPDLARRDPERLAEALKAQAGDEDRPAAAPGAGQVSDWVSAAGELGRMLRF